ncbi:TetR/AcrR family transcriptional regulator [Actinomadura oligospora]|uniref:TetR/AcrR family transcriptional regulator n=1 Tax=Actinomadura oligospora TaxID=111804 RepID=UPI0004BA1ECE|nr:TetR/AcrR family transcriptional regulator [Actinomadura oligospora]
MILEAAVRLVGREGLGGLRTGPLAAEAGLSPGWIPRLFEDRASFVRQLVEVVHDRAVAYTGEADAITADPRARLELLLLLELQETPEVRETSATWARLRASAATDLALRNPLRRATQDWNRVLCIAIRRGTSWRLPRTRRSG